MSTFYLTEYQGAYFDSTLLAISRWPTAQIPSLSIVQDPIDSTMGFASRQGFAQPLVFFRMDPNMASLLQSPAMVDSLNHLRLRIPGRPMVRSLCLPSASQVNCNSGATPQVPDLELLDLSTCGVLEGEVDTILAQFGTLKHLILDDCPILKGDHREGEWNAMGKRCALVGVRRAREREKIIKASVESFMLASQLELMGLDDAPAQLPERRPRRGRRGIANSTISLRAPSPPRGVEALRARIGNSGRTPAAIQRTRVLPPLPSLKTFCTTISSNIKPEAYPAIRNEFEAGWAEGIAVLAVTRARLRDSAKNHISNIVRFSDNPGESVSTDSESDSSSTKPFPLVPMNGLEKVHKDDVEAFGMPAEIVAGVPTVCFAGSSGVVDHAPGCGHAFAGTIWKD